MLKFHCPDFYRGFNIYQKILKLKIIAPECFNENVEIASIFGFFPGGLWNGGSHDMRPHYQDIREIEAMADFYQSVNIPLKLTATNSKLIPTDCYDRYCNKILSILDNRNNEILVNSLFLEQYIREKYPNYKIVKSITATKEDQDINEILSKYDSMVLPRRHNLNFELLSQIPVENRSRIEILCNETCPSNCPRLYSHYDVHSEITTFDKNIATPDIYCTTKKRLFAGVNNPEIITLEDLKNKYEPMGYNSIKISGRGDEFTVAINLLPYLFKQEYQLEVLKILLQYPLESIR